MFLEPIQQIINQLRLKRNILITTRANPRGDSLASALAFYLIMKKIGKRADVVIQNHDFQKNEIFSFLPGYESIISEIPREQKTILKFPITEGSVRSLTYKTNNRNLIITIIPESKNQNICLGNPDTSKPDYPYDVIVSLGAEDIESLGSVYEDHTEFFYHTPIINIDNKNENDHFGEINLVELTAASTTEILFSLVENLDKNLINQDIATCLLAGIIFESNGFQSQNITPRTLTISAELINAGAKRALIVERFFGPEPVGTLQTWGRIFSKLKTDTKKGIVWSVLSKEDVSELKNINQRIESAIDRSLSNIKGTKTVIVAFPNKELLSVIVNSVDPMLDLRKTLIKFNPQGSKGRVFFDVSNLEAEKTIQEISKYIEDSQETEHLIPKF
jgi:bifunctional oligoribonuclease and PAP phosphatase NrnA